MRILIGSILFLCMNSLPLSAQETSGAGDNIENWKSVLTEAVELQATEPSSVAEKLASLLSELLRLREEGTLQPERPQFSRMRSCWRRVRRQCCLRPEDDILAFMRELLVVAPGIDESIFNPREKLLLEKLRSTETGSVSLETDPSGAVLSYLGAEMGKSPGKFALIAESNRFRLSLPGYLDRNVEVTVRPEEVNNLSLQMRRRAVNIPICDRRSLCRRQAQWRECGRQPGYKDWLASLSAEQRPEYEAIVRQWNLDTAEFSFFRLAEMPVDESLRLEFLAACRQPLVWTLKLMIRALTGRNPCMSILSCATCS